jgi:hypothetical protein
VDHPSHICFQVGIQPMAVALFQIVDVGDYQALHHSGLATESSADGFEVVEETRRFLSQDLIGEALEEV